MNDEKEVYGIYYAEKLGGHWSIRRDLFTTKELAEKSLKDADLIYDEKKSIWYDKFDNRAYKIFPFYLNGNLKDIK